MYLRGVRSHVSRGPEFGPLHPIVLPVEGWRPVKLQTGAMALMVCIVPASPCRPAFVFAGTVLLEHSFRIARQQCLETASR